MLDLSRISETFSSEKNGFAKRATSKEIHPRKTLGEIDERLTISCQLYDRNPAATPDPVSGRKPLDPGVSLKVFANGIS